MSPSHLPSGENGGIGCDKTGRLTSVSPVSVGGRNEGNTAPFWELPPASAIGCWPPKRLIPHAVGCCSGTLLPLKENSPNFELSRTERTAKTCWERVTQDRYIRSFFSCCIRRDICCLIPKSPTSYSFWISILLQQQSSNQTPATPRRRTTKVSIQGVHNKRPTARKPIAIAHNPTKKSPALTQSPPSPPVPIPVLNRLQRLVRTPVSAAVNLFLSLPLSSFQRRARQKSFCSVTVLRRFVSPVYFRLYAALSPRF